MSYVGCVLLKFIATWCDNNCILLSYYQFSWHSPDFFIDNWIAGCHVIGVLHNDLWNLTKGNILHTCLMYAPIVEEAKGIHHLKKTCFIVIICCVMNGWNTHVASYIATYMIIFISFPLCLFASTISYTNITILITNTLWC